MPDEFKGDWDVRVMQQLKGTDMFLSDRPSYKVPSHSTTAFRFGFKINANNYDPDADNMTMNGDSFTGSFIYGGTTYHVKAKKVSLTSNLSGLVSLTGGCTYIVGVIGKPDLNLECQLPDITATDVISFTAIKTG